MREPRNYDALRATERQVLAKQEFARAGHEVTARQERPEPEPEPEPQAAALEPPFMSDEERIDAERAALWAKLDADVESGKLNKAEAKYAREHFETDGVRQPTSSGERAETQNRSGQVGEQTADDGLMSIYVSEEAKAKQKEAQAAREQQRGGRTGGWGR